jgi:HEAT repeat protein
MLRHENDPLPLLSGLHALGHIGDSLAVPLLVQHRSHLSADVRLAVAYALGSFADDPRAVDSLLALMRDIDDDVRDWATFGLGVQGDLDSQEIRDALLERMSDPNRDVREESLVGLGKRKDQRALAALISELNQSEISERLIDAAKAFLSEKEPEADRDPNSYVDALKRYFPDRC